MMCSYKWGIGCDMSNGFIGITLMTSGARAFLLPNQVNQAALWLCTRTLHDTWREQESDRKTECHDLIQQIVRGLAAILLLYHDAAYSSISKAFLGCLASRWVDTCVRVLEILNPSFAIKFRRNYANDRDGTIAHNAHFIAHGYNIAIVPKIQKTRWNGWLTTLSLLKDRTAGENWIRQLLWWSWSLLANAVQGECRSRIVLIVAGQTSVRVCFAVISEEISPELSNLLSGLVGKTEIRWWDSRYA
nr:hypothetical protein CFP56_20474 [Quercus suber]